MSSPWSDMISPDDEARYAAAGFGRPVGLGERPALLIIDVQYRTIGDSPKPFFESLADYPTSCGERGWAAVENIARLLSVFRARRLPVLYPHVARKVAAEGGRLAGKVPAIMGVADRGYDFVAEVAPDENAVLLPKKHPSAFFGTALVSHLIDLGVDTLVVTGATTSGCVRSTVVDAFAYNFRVAVPHDACYDRADSVHQVNLFDMGQKYADVASTDELVAALASPVPADRAG
ncbi:isochorismatase family protein [Pseudonocardia pini]|uniref:isochorismatase family protein n=1 Tax=Pseudonocardia pini TaxID=2758030 RepID=UPI001C68ECE1|nr:isochorismatase family protein [Pseudonocardia pini]